jgi:hypothetical protein
MNNKNKQIEPHADVVVLHHSFNSIHERVSKKGELNLTTESGTPFSARADIAQKGNHAGEKVIRFCQDDTEYGRAYECCWGHYYNCNRTRIGMYCKALDSEIESYTRNN